MSVMNRPLISIVLPIYNVEKYLERCLNSLISQTYDNIEIIAVDDGSTDKSFNICEQYAGIDNRIKVIHKSNGGLSDARNVGIDECSGEYLAFVDSDDYIEIGMIEKLYDLLKAENADMSICNINYVNENGICLEEFNKESPIKNSIYTQTEMYTKLAESGYWFFVTAWNKLYKRSLFDDIRFPKGKYHEDEFVIHYIISHCGKVVCLQDRLYNYVQRQGSIMNSSFSVKNLDGIEAKLDRAVFFCERQLFDQAVASLVNIVDSLHKAHKELPEHSSQVIINTLKENAKLCFEKISKQTHISFKKKVKFTLFFKTPRLYNIVVTKFYMK